MVYHKIGFFLVVLPESAVTFWCPYSAGPPGPVTQADEHLATESTKPVKVRRAAFGAVRVMGAAHPDEAVVARRGRAKDVLGSDVKPQVVPQVAGDEGGVDLVGEGADVHLVALAANRPGGSIVAVVVSGHPASLVGWGSAACRSSQTGFDIGHHLCHIAC